MGELFLKLADMSITASWLVFAVIALRLVLKKAPKWVMSLLWALVALRLVCPITLESALSLVPDRQPLYDGTAHGSVSLPEPDYQAAMPRVEPVITPAAPADPYVPAPPAVAEPAPRVDILAESKKPTLVSALAVIWVCGVGAMLCYTLISYMVLRGKVRESVRLRGNIRLCDSIPSPFILGVFAPKIYLPSNLPDEDMEYVLAHENAHLKRGDHLWKPFGFLLLSVYWFNPIMWLAYSLMCRDIELACDEKVIKKLGDGRKRSYSLALINCSAPRRIISACPVAFGEVGVKERIKRVLSYKKPAFWVIIAALLATAAVAVCLMTNPVDKSDGITLPEDIKITAAGLRGGKIELFAGESYAKLTDEQIKELKTCLSGMKTGKLVRGGAPNDYENIVITTTAGGFSLKSDAVPHSYELWYNSDDTAYITVPDGDTFELDDKAAIEFMKSVKRENGEGWSDIKMTASTSTGEVTDISVTSRKEEKFGKKIAKTSQASYRFLDDGYFERESVLSELEVNTVTLNLSGIEVEVTIYRDKDGRIELVNPDDFGVVGVVSVVGFGEAKIGGDTVERIILSRYMVASKAETAYEQYYVYEPKKSPDTVRSIVPMEAYGLPREEFYKNQGEVVKWSRSARVNTDFTRLAYYSDKYLKDGEPSSKSGIWVADIESGKESRLSLPDEMNFLDWGDDPAWTDSETVVFSVYDKGIHELRRLSMNVVTGEMTEYTSQGGSPYEFKVYTEKDPMGDYDDRSIVGLTYASDGNVLYFNLSPDFELSTSTPSRADKTFLDGRYLVFELSNNNGFKIIDLETEELYCFKYDESGYTYYPVIECKNGRLYLVSYDMLGFDSRIQCLDIERLIKDSPAEK